MNRRSPCRPVVHFQGVFQPAPSNFIRLPRKMLSCGCQRAWLSRKHLVHTQRSNTSETLDRVNYYGLPTVNSYMIYRIAQLPMTLNARPENCDLALCNFRAISAVVDRQVRMFAQFYNLSVSVPRRAWKWTE